MIEAVLFDVDGVLVTGGNFGRLLMQQYAVPRAVLDEFFRGPFARCTLGTADLKVEIAPLLSRWRFVGSVEECLLQWFEADAVVNSVMFQHAARLRGAGLLVGIASTQEHYRASYLEQEVGLARDFDELFFSCRLGVRKPDAELYRRVQQALDIKPEAILLVDDQQKNVDAAHNAGWRAERYTLGGDAAGIFARHGL